jgi:hypothetical protein
MQPLSSQLRQRIIGDGGLAVGFSQIFKDLYDCRVEYLGLVNPYAHVGRREKRKKQQESLSGGSSLTRKAIIE